MHKLAYHFNVWVAFNRTVYHKTLTQDNIINGGNEKYVDKVYRITEKSTGKCEVEEDVFLDCKCVFLEKNSTKYILPSRYLQHLPLNMKEGFDCYLKPSDKTVHKVITEPVSVRITPQKTLSFRDLVTVFNPLMHSDQRTYTFLKIQAIASKAKGGKYRLCSKPNGMKNANDTLLQCITNDNVKVSKPTIAKLETLFYFNQKVIMDEMTSLTAAQVREIEPLILNLGDESPSFEKHSMAQRKDMNEVDTTMTSAIFTYNDPDSIGEDGKFFDDIWQNVAAFNSRYPAFLLEGEVVDEHGKLSMAEANKIAKENFDQLRIIAKNLVYYYQNMHTEMHRFDRSKYCLRGRKKINTECILDALDVYCQSQEEYDEWLMWMNDRIKAYKDVVGRYKAGVVEKVKEEWVK